MGGFAGACWVIKACNYGLFPVFFAARPGCRRHFFRLSGYWKVVFPRTCGYLMFMRRLGGVLLILSLLWFTGLTAYAQVAVPSLVPAGARIRDPRFDIPAAPFVTANPAAIQWGASSKWGFGRLGSKRTQTVPAGNANTVNYSGLVVGFRRAEKGFSFAGSRQTALREQA